MKRSITPKRAILLIIIAVFFFITDYYKNSSTEPNLPANSTTVQKAFNNQQQSVQVSGNGTVVKILPDDLKGSKHQKFILKISNNLTILIAHNIDLAPKITTLQKGDTVSFHGEYEFNNKGGLVHWTHHDPRKKHPDGWLQHKGQTYK